MKNLTLSIVLLITGCFASCGRSGQPTGVQSSFELVQAPVLRVYSTMEGEHRFVAYAVKWKDAEIIVSDPLARSHFQVGNPISFMAQKVHLDKTNTGTQYDVLNFQIIEPPGLTPK